MERILVVRRARVVRGVCGQNLQPLARGFEGDAEERNFEGLAVLRWLPLRAEADVDPGGLGLVVRDVRGIDGCRFRIARSITSFDPRVEGLDRRNPLVDVLGHLRAVLGTVLGEGHVDVQVVDSTWPSTTSWWMMRRSCTGSLSLNSAKRSSLITNVSSLTAKASTVSSARIARGTT